jgi:hypothetical protein
MKAVIFNPQQGNPKIERLIDYIYRLSKVTVEVISWKKDIHWLNEIGNKNESFRYTADKIKEDFIWLEPDSIPLTEDWFDELKERWNEKDQGIIGLISTDFQSPFDLSCSVGVYSNKIRNSIPQGFQGVYFDSWLSNPESDKVERTGLIQHSYAVYNNKGEIVRNYSFPNDNWILRETSVIFHSDKEQSLITDYDTPEKEEILTP